MGRTRTFEHLPDRLPDTVQGCLAEAEPASWDTVLQVELRQTPPRPGEPLSLPAAVGRALLHNPRLLVYRASVARAAGRAEVAFAPFLPHVGVLTRAGTVNPKTSPGAPGIVGSIVPERLDVPYHFAQSELQIQWTLCDFGRTQGRYGQALSREKIASLQYSRARESIAFEAVTAYLEALQAQAIRRIQEEAIRLAETVLEDVRTRQQAGVALREAVLRAEVQLADARDGLLVARESELAALGRLQNVLGCDASQPVEILERETTPALAPSLPECLTRALRQRPEVAATREAIAVAYQGREAAAAEFRPRVYMLSGLANAQGENILSGWSAGVGIHLNQPLYAGGKYQAEVCIAEAEIEEAAAQSRVLLDAVNLEVTLAYRHATTARQRIDQAQPAVERAEESLRLVRERSRNGDATALELVDAQTATTRARQRLVSARYEYQSALARLDYALGNAPLCLVEGKELPAPAPRPLPPLPPQTSKP